MSECDNLEKRVKMLIVDGWRYQTVRDKNGIAVRYGWDRWDNGQSSLTDKELKAMTDTEFLDLIEHDKPANNDAINHPAYYTDGKIEVSDFIADKNLNFFRGNVVKYVTRAGKKDPAREVEDLKKAQWYINREIERLEAAHV